MIYSDQQYRISTRELTQMKDALTNAQAPESDQAWLRDAQIAALRSQIAELEAEIAHYDLLKAGEITFAKSFELENLPTILVEARIAAGMSQTDLAQTLGIKPQQIQRYEASNYMGASLARLIEISKILNVHTAGLFEGDRTIQGAIVSWANVDDIVWQQFPINEMRKRRWFDLPRGVDVVRRVKEYILEAAGPEFLTAFHRKKINVGTMPNEYSLLAWQARVLERARKKVAHSGLPEFVLDDRWLPALVALTRRADGPRRARDLLARKGIVLITEEHLSGTYLDGAAMLMDDGRPVIGVTLRYDRLDNFWFVLLHELGHVFLHLMNGLRYDFFDEEGPSEGDRVELEADAFALNRLISDEAWDQCLSRFAMTEEAVRLDAEKLGIDASIIAGRIRKEQGNYTILNNLVGQDCVSSQLAEVEDDLA